MRSQPIQLKTLGDTDRLAKALAKVIKVPMQIGLSGSLGAGKTTFSSCLVKALGSNEPVSSPTFVLCHEYQAQGIKIEHWDLYRLSGAVDELLSSPESDTIRLIEWPERAPELANDFELTIEFHVAYDSEPRRSAALVGSEALVKLITQHLENPGQTI